MGYDVKIILDSVTPAGARLTTFEITLPRIVLAEFNTHKMISKNSASSRAIPVEKKVARVMANPFIPKTFGKNQRGMQAAEYLDENEDALARTIWTRAISFATVCAEELAKVKVHKQLANRLIEFADHHTIVATGTEWSNMFALRDHPMAQDEIRDPMHLAKELHEKSAPTFVPAGSWHLPYVTGYDVAEPPAGWPVGNDFHGWSTMDLVAMSAGRCAAVSHLNQDNHLDPAGDIRRAWEKLIPNGHMSPTEHQAQSLTWAEWDDYATAAAKRWIVDRVPVGNLWGWRQWRKTIENEHDFALLEKR